MLNLQGCVAGRCALITGAAMRCKAGRQSIHHRVYVIHARHPASCEEARVRRLVCEEARVRRHV